MGVSGLQLRALRGLSVSERAASFPCAFGRSAWAEAQLRAGVVTRGRGRTRGRHAGLCEPGPPRDAQRGGLRPGPRRHLAGNPSAKEVSRSPAEGIPASTEEPSPTLHLLPLWPGERRSGPRSSCPRITRIAGAGPPILGPCSSPGAGPSILSPRASLVRVYLSLIFACSLFESYSWSPESLVRILPFLISGDP